MAKGIYVGSGNTAKKVKKAYIGVGGVARKIKKGYIGVGGVARLFYSAETLVPFTSNPAPINGWTYSSSIKDSATNDYGTWTVEAKDSYASNYYVASAFDNGDYTGWSSAKMSDYTTTSYIQLNTPNGVSINPTQIFVRGACFEDGVISGLNEKGVWENLVTGIYDMSGGNYTSKTFTIATDNYYSAIRLTAHRSDNVSAEYIVVQELRVLSGTLKIG